MQTPRDMVAEFHAAFGLPIRAVPEVAVPEAELRAELIREEFKELTDALLEGDVVEVADALADLVYVVYGAALTFGIDLDTILQEVHRTNMAKLGTDGKPIRRADGKVIKPEGWQPPNLVPILEASGW